MFKDFKSQFHWCIMSTFLTGVITGIDLSFIERNEIFWIFIIINILSIIFSIAFWKTIFSRLDLQDKINSIWNHD